MGIVHTLAVGDDGSVADDLLERMEVREAVLGFICRQRDRMGGGPADGFSHGAWRFLLGDTVSLRPT